MLNKKTIAIIVMAVILLIAVGYIVDLKLGNAKEIRETEIFNNGAIEGYTFAIQNMMQEVSKCEPVPLTYANQTINLIALECYGEQ